MIFHSLGFAQPTLLLRTGTLTDEAPVSDPFVNCLFGQYEPGCSVRRAEITMKALPLAQALDVRPGDVFQPDGRVIGASEIRRYRSTIRIDPRLVTRTRQALVEAGVLPPSPFHAGVDLAGTDLAYWALAKVLDSKTGYLAIPCLELFWAYFAPSSKRAHAFFRQKVYDELKALERDERNRIDSAGKAILHLGQGHLVSDVIPLARMFFDQYAREEVRKINTSITLSRKRRTPLALRCNFPFQGETTLSYEGVEWVNTKTGVTTRIALRLLHCSHSLPWTQLDAYLDQSQSTQKTSGNENRKSRRYEDFTDEFKKLNPDDKPPAHGDKDIVRSRTSTAFSTSVRIHRNIVDTTKKRYKKNPDTPPNNSARTSRADGDTNSKGTHVAGDGARHAENETSPVAAFSSVTLALEELHELDNVSYAALELVDNLVTYNSWVLNEFPERTGHTPSWKTIKGGSQIRCFFAAALQLNESVIYLLEILRNPRESYATLLVKFPNGRQEQGELLTVVNAINAKQGLLSERGFKTLVKDGTFVRIRHPAADRAPSPQPLRRSIIQLLKDNT